MGKDVFCYFYLRDNNFKETIGTYLSESVIVPPGSEIYLTNKAAPMSQALCWVLLQVISFGKHN